MTAFRFAALISLAFVATAAQAQTTDSQTTNSTTTTDSEMVVATPHPAAVPVPTATPTSNKATTAGKPMTTDEQITAWVHDAPKLDHAAPADDGETLQADGTPAPRQIHGSAGVSVGSNGYSSAYVSSLIPVGKDSTLGIAVAQSNWGGTTVDHGKYRLPKGRSQSVAVSLQIGNGNGTVPDGCPGFMDGGRYVEPVWWSRLHPDEPCVTETDTHTETTYGQ